MPVTVLLQPVGPVDASLLRHVARRVSEALPVPARVTVNITPVEPPLEAMDWGRLQYRAWQLNEVLHDLYREFTGAGVKVVGVVEGDGYVEGLNFVFGLASPELGVATVYTARLRGPPFRERLVKEVLHELGHLLGLGHCPNPRCVMSFSNSVEEVDRKEAWFCEECTLKLRRLHGEA